ncbi:hypothetical protein PHMEG_0008076 [Phytophthora megakarya]|uniref:Uncharacterized protein n=1 Tax=Phytophthora megakarya TaxID=4795 RepID=A0A225WK39_9STRA|nr:hypothetical protein PHMEG_0008076 [Phytophthora megakarya]
MLTLRVETFHTRRSKLNPWHAFSEEDLALFKPQCLTWKLEDGFPFDMSKTFNEPSLKQEHSVVLD